MITNIHAYSFLPIPGTGLTIFNGDKKHEIIVGVVGEYHTDIGCKL